MNLLHQSHQFKTADAIAEQIAVQSEVKKRGNEPCRHRFSGNDTADCGRWLRHFNPHKALLMCTSRYRRYTVVFPEEL